MSDVLIAIDEVVLQTEAERSQVERAGQALAEAFRLLGKRLERAPAGAGGGRGAAIALVTTTALPLDELLSPRGAERIADEIYRRILEKHA